MSPIFFDKKKVHRRDISLLVRLFFALSGEPATQGTDILESGGEFGAVKLAEML
jgi:hypothetical protein